MAENPQNTSTERTRRRARQFAAVEQAKAEVLMVPSELGQPAEPMPTITEIAPIPSAVAPIVEPEPVPSSGLVMVRGEQASLQMANRLARMHDTEERDIVTDAAKAAGIAVRSALRDMPHEADLNKRYRSREQHNAFVAPKTE